MRMKYGRIALQLDEEKYDDRHGQVLSLGGWYAGSDRQEMSFCLVGDGNQELVLADPERYERPDVAQALEADFGEFLPGFRLRIPKADQLAEQFQADRAVSYRRRKTSFCVEEERR